MSLSYNGVVPTKITYNGTRLTRVYYNGVLVWETTYQTWVFEVSTVYRQAATGSSNIQTPTGAGSFQLGINGSGDACWNAFIPQGAPISDFGEVRPGSARLHIWIQEISGTTSAGVNCTRCYVRGGCGMSNSGFSEIRTPAEGNYTPITIQGTPESYQDIPLSDALFQQLAGTIITFNDAPGYTIGGSITWPASTVWAKFKSGTYDMWVAADFYTFYD